MMDFRTNRRLQLPLQGKANILNTSIEKKYRRVVTGHGRAKSVVLSDTLLAHSFQSIPGYDQTHVWANYSGDEADVARTDAQMPNSALPSATGSILQIVTFPPKSRRSGDSTDPAAVVQESHARPSGLVDTFEHDGSEMHRTPTVDYAPLLDGKLWLEHGEDETVHLSAGDIVVQQVMRHGGPCKSDRPATIVFLMLGANR